MIEGSGFVINHQQKLLLNREGNEEAAKQREVLPVVERVGGMDCSGGGTWVEAVGELEATGKREMAAGSGDGW